MSENSRWTYRAGSRPEGVVLYDDGPNGGSLKIHSHHDTDPARGQQNAFDMVRLHMFGSLDHPEHQSLPITQRPSYRAMVALALQQPEVRSVQADSEFEDLGPAPVVTEEVEEKADGTERFRVVAADAFATGRPMEWIVRGVLPKAELAVIYGESGSGKSFLTLDLCAAISRGLAWRERTTSSGRCVYICAEGAGGFRSRLRAYAVAKSVELHELPAVIPEAPNLLEVKDAADIIRALQAWGRVDVVVVDTLSATTPGGNENSGEDMGRVLSHCKTIHRKTGALVILIHHSGKDAARGARGWSGLRAAADAELEVTRSGEHRAVTITKMKDGVDGQAFGFKLKTVPLGTTEEGDTESSCVIEHTEVRGAREKWKPSGRNQQAIWRELEKLSTDGSPVGEDIVIEAAIKARGGDPGEDPNLRDNLRKAIGDMAAADRLYRNDGMISFHEIKVTSDAEYLE